MQKNCYPKNLHFPGYNPVDAGMHTCPPGHSPRTRMRTHWLLHFVLEGKGIFQTDKGAYEVTAGQCFVIRPNEVTTYKADTTDPWHYVWVGFTADSIPKYLHTEDVLHVPFLEPVFRQIEESIDYYQGEAGANGGKEAYLCGKITEIMMRLELHFSRPAESKAQSEMRAVKNHIDTHLASPLSVQALAEEFHLNSVYLSRRFKEVVGLSPQNYIVKKRLDEAAALMTVQGFTPSAAAEAVGYTSIYLFSKMFKRRFGVSPREYVRSFNSVR